MGARQLGIIAIAMVGMATLTGAVSSQGATGTVYDDLGQPLKAAVVEARRLEGGAFAERDIAASPFMTVRTDANGAWTLAPLPAGNWAICVTTSNPLAEGQGQPAGGCTDNGKVGSKSFVHVDDVDASTKVIAFRVVSATSAESPLRGRLQGAFEPSRFGYQIYVSPELLVQPTPGSEGGQQSYSMLTTGTVPAMDGTFCIDVSGARGDLAIVVEASLLGSNVEHVRAATERILVRNIPVSDGELQLKLSALSLVQLTSRVEPQSTPVEVVYELWNEFDAGPEYWHARTDLAAAGLLPEGSYVIDGYTDQLASGIAVLAATPGFDVSRCSLVLEPCVTYSIHLMDREGRPLQTTGVRIGNAATASLSSPFRIRRSCTSGMLKVEHLLAGVYDLEVTLVDGKQYRQAVTLGERTSMQVVVPQY